MLGGEVQVGHQLLKGVDEGHSFSNIQCKFKHLGSFNNNIALLVKHVEEGAMGEVLCDDHQIRGAVAAPHHWQHIRMGKYSGEGERMLIKYLLV